MQGHWRYYVKDSEAQVQDSPGEGGSMQRQMSVHLS